MATVKDRAKIRAALSIVALSVTMGIDSSIFKGTPSVVAVPVEHTQELEDKKKAVSVKAYGNVKAESIQKAQDLLSTYLDNTDYVDNCVVIEGDTVESFTRGKLKIPNRKLQEGERISTSEDVNIYVAENTLETDIPSAALAINSFMAKKGGKL
ncbi:MAG: hypothetical protein IKP66_01565 [Lachnospiraceae bacterium]|nr:hypothetical protein [Lachnospiraceae bacterium]